MKEAWLGRSEGPFVSLPSLLTTRVHRLLAEVQRVACSHS